MHLRGSHDDEESLSVCLELRPLVSAMRVFNGQIVKLKLFLDLFQHIFVRLVETDPDKAVGIGKMLADIFDRNRGNFAAVAVRGTVHDTFDMMHMAILSARLKEKDNRFGNWGSCRIVGFALQRARVEGC
jgi:hypothetical protein